ncbi:hypothetical protein ACLB2K_039516 [Fragaria x ananassa]
MRAGGPKVDNILMNWSRLLQVRCRSMRKVLRRRSQRSRSMVTIVAGVGLGLALVQAMSVFGDGFIRGRGREGHIVSVCACGSWQRQVALCRVQWRVNRRVDWTRFN